MLFCFDINEDGKIECQNSIADKAIIHKRVNSNFRLIDKGEKEEKENNNVMWK